MTVFSDDVVRFIASSIDSIDQLEILRLLSLDATRRWSPVDLAEQLQTEPQSITKDLEALAKRGLLTLHRGSGLACQHGALTSEGEIAIRELLQAYNERPVTMIRMLEGSVT